MSSLLAVISYLRQGEQRVVYELLATRTTTIVDEIVEVAFRGYRWEQSTSRRL